MLQNTILVVLAVHLGRGAFVCMIVHAFSSAESYFFADISRALLGVRFAERKIRFKKKGVRPRAVQCTYFLA